MNTEKSGTAIRTGRPCWTRDIRRDANFAVWKGEALKRGYGSSIDLPLRSDGEPFGALSLYAAEPDAFNETTLELTEFIGVVMDTTERKRSEEALREAQAELVRVARATTMGELTASIAHEVNQPLAAVVTYTPAPACIGSPRKRRTSMRRERPRRRSIGMRIGQAM